MRRLAKLKSSTKQYTRELRWLASMANSAAAPPVAGADGHDQIASMQFFRMCFDYLFGRIRRGQYNAICLAERDNGPLFMGRDFVAGLVFFCISRSCHEICEEQELMPSPTLQIRTSRRQDSACLHKEPLRSQILAPQQRFQALDISRALVFILYDINNRQCLQPIL